LFHYINPVLLTNKGERSYSYWDAYRYSGTGSPLQQWSDIGTDCPGKRLSHHLWSYLKHVEVVLQDLVVDLTVLGLWLDSYFEGLLQWKWFYSIQTFLLFSQTIW